MTRHGGGLSIAQGRHGLGQDLAGPLPPDQVWTTAIPAGHRPVKIEGFRHFLSDDDVLPIDKQFQVHGQDPLRSAESVKGLRNLMAGLAMRMRRERDRPWDPHGVPGVKPWENPYLPAGYTYLLQLIAHDLVQTTYPLSILEDTTTGVRNDRMYRLKLDTIYGGGPQVCPFAYAIDKDSAVRSALRLGPDKVEDADKPMISPNRDIARLDLKTRATGEARQLTEPLIADPRNDDHAILAQLTALFHHLHNGLIGLLPAPADKVVADSTTEAVFDRFLCARGAVTLMYRNVIRHDVMKRLLHPDVYKEYGSDNPSFLTAHSTAVRNSSADDQSTKGMPRREFLIPLEFTHGAFRFGHAMVRDEYRMNERDGSVFEIDKTLLQNSLLRPFKMPLNRDWIVQWSRFFELHGNDDRLQYSHRIGPHFSGGLNDEKLFAKIDFTGREGIAYRDLMSSAFVRLWSVNALIEEIRVQRPGLIAQSRLLDDRRHRVERLRAWLGVERERSGLSDSDIATLADDPPLHFFIQFEAAEEAHPAGGGMHLGILGSTIVAEVIFGALVRDPFPNEAVRRSLTDTLSRHSQDTYAANCLKEVPDITTMSALIEFTAKIAGLSDADPAFL